MQKDGLKIQPGYGAGQDGSTEMRRMLSFAVLGYDIDGPVLRIASHYAPISRGGEDYIDFHTLCPFSQFSYQEKISDVSSANPPMEKVGRKERGYKTLYRQIGQKFGI